MRDGFNDGATMGTVIENYTQPPRFSKYTLAAKSKRISDADVDMSYRSCHRDQAAAAAAADPETPTSAVPQSDALDEDEIERLKPRFKHWANPNTTTGIAKFMRKIDPDMSYTKEQIEAMGGNPDDITHYKKEGTDRKGNGVIFKNTNDIYTLHTQLIHLYRQFFH
jgi:hypothetical protein